MNSDPHPEKKPLDLAAIRAKLAAQAGKRSWTSLEELAESTEFLEFLHREFPRETSWVKSLNRRDFLKLLAAPLALAGLSACIPQPVELIMPYVEAPEEVIPGQPLYFATALEMNGYARGVLVESHEGRPIKVEGNPLHPDSLGATDAFTQASILTLYDPDRAQAVTHRGQIRTWESFQAELLQALENQRGQQGAGLRLLTQTITSPTLTSQIRALLEAFPQARWHQYSPVNRDNEREGARLAFGEVVDTHYNFQAADVVLSLDNDFMFLEPAALRYTREFSGRRRPGEGEGSMNRLYMIESSFSLTGSNADHRVALSLAQIEVFARRLAFRMGIAVDPGPTASPVPEAWLAALADDLNAHRGRCLVLAGPQQPPIVHALAHALNAAQENVGSTVYYTDPVEPRPVNHLQSLRELTQDLQNGTVELLVILDGNPVYDAPADLNFGEAVAQARLSAYLGLYRNETARACHWHIPATHYLEMWSDTRASDGTVSIIQPLIFPLYNNHSSHELLALMLGSPAAEGYDIVRRFWEGQFAGLAGGPAGTALPEESPASTPAPPTGEGGEGEAGEETEAQQTPEPVVNGQTFTQFWRRALHVGVIAGTRLLPREGIALRPDFLDAANAVSPQPVDTQTIELLFLPDYSVWDGNFSNNAWLQELPRPLTKLTWDNAALISPRLAARLNLQNEQVIELTYRQRSILAPVWILPGQPENTITLHLGFGRQAGGEVQEGAGVNAYALRTSDAPWGGSGVDIRPTSRRYSLAITQDHFRMEGRDLVRTGTLAQFQENPDFVNEMGHELEVPEALRSEDDGVVPQMPSLFPEFEYTGNAWGMAINLSACTGCNACVMACQVENNIPVVGKEQVLIGREMHWLRIDRYFEGDLDNPEILNQPVLCMHCEKAPCEPVCPVNATLHDSEGLNEMVYARCIGTRYCSNNCPYKVRRFNFLDYVDENIIPLKLWRNPDVTVRSRGVMEKCTYCIQRISDARIRAKAEGREIDEGDVVTACQQACPAQAIVFGDINREDSQVRRMKEQPLNYGLLAELGTQPRTSYLARLRNPNPNLPPLEGQT